MDDPFCIVVDLENCDDMLHWLLACKITFAIATFAVEDEQKNRASNTFQQFAISTGRYTVLQDGTFGLPNCYRVMQ